MSEIRTNPFTGEMSLYAENRRNRPYEFVHNTERKHANSEKCPFCGGHEAWTPDAIYQDGPNGAWQMRVFPNKFPTVREDCTDAAEEPFYTQTAGRGRHEILVDTPDHDATIDTFDAAHIASILQVLQDRLHFFRNRADTQYADFQKLRALRRDEHAPFALAGGGAACCAEACGNHGGGYAQRGLPVLQNACLRKGNEQAYCGGNRAFSCAYALRRTLCL